MTVKLERSGSTIVLTETLVSGSKGSASWDPRDEIGTKRTLATWTLKDALGLIDTLEALVADIERNTTVQVYGQPVNLHKAREIYRDLQKELQRYGAID